MAEPKPHPTTHLTAQQPIQQTIHELSMDLGVSLKKLRLEKNMSRKEVCKFAGLGIATLERIEAGRGGTITNLLKLLKVLKKEAWLQSLAPSISINPLLSVTERQRATKTKIELRSHSTSRGKK